MSMPNANVALLILAVVGLAAIVFTKVGRICSAIVVAVLLTISAVRFFTAKPVNPDLKPASYYQQKYGYHP